MPHRTPTTTLENLAAEEYIDDAASRVRMPPAKRRPDTSDADVAARADADSRAADGGTSPTR
ncbi:hypothetical protein [Jatrophihabitans fulvus]